MTSGQGSQHPRRIYPLSPAKLTEEQLAVVFAMTSRRPEPFSEIAQQVSQEKAAQFHERWVLGYGHASVAEHAILHMAVENISRLACDTLEDNRLASYTEKSSRYQVLDRGYYHVPQELQDPRLRELYVRTCDHLFDTYHYLLEKSLAYLRVALPPKEGERESAYALRLRRQATDHCRFVLPAATLTNVGVTMNARAMEHAITKLLSSELVEEQQIGEELKARGREITPTLIKYAERSQYLVETRKAQRAEAEVLREFVPSVANATAEVTLVHFDPEAEAKVAAAFLTRYSGAPYSAAWEYVKGLSRSEVERLLGEALSRLGPFDAPIRELEYADYTFEMIMDYGAYREFKRHRMQSYLAQPLTVDLGYVVPDLVSEAGLEDRFNEAMEEAAEGYRQIKALSPAVAQYLVTHAHKVRVLTKMNARECYHVFKLRTSPQAHFTIRRVLQKAMELVSAKHPALFRHIGLVLRKG